MKAALLPAAIELEQPIDHWTWPKDCNLAAVRSLATIAPAMRKTSATRVWETSTRPSSPWLLPAL